MRRTCFYTCWLGLTVVALVACGRRAALTLDSSGSGTPPPDSGAADGAAPRVCSGLRLVGKVSLGDPATSKMHPRVVFDGTQFAVVWHSQPAQVSSLNGDLRLARVSPLGTAGATHILGKDNGAVPHALTATTGELALVHMPSSASGQPALERRLMDVNGVTKHGAMIKGWHRHVALVPHPSGHALLLAQQSGIPSVVIMSRSGKISNAAAMITAQVMASLWIGSSPNGYAALLHSTNSNGELHLFNHSFKDHKIGSLGQGALIRSPSMAVVPGGYAAIYNTSWSKIYSEVLDASGKSSGRRELAPAPWAGGIPGMTALAWTGHQLAAVSPSSTKGRFVARLLTPAGKPSAALAVKLPVCLSNASSVSAAWGKGRLAVATLDRAVTSIQSSVCVTVLECL